MVVIDGFGGAVFPPRRSPEEERRRREREQENMRRKEINHSTLRCLECKHFFFGDRRHEYNHDPIQPWEKHTSLRGRDWDRNEDVVTWRSGYCRLHPEPIKKLCGDTCGQIDADEVRFYQMIQFYGECFHDMLHAVYPERDWYLQDFPPQAEPHVRNVEETRPNHMDEELFEVE